MPRMSGAEQVDDGIGQPGIAYPLQELANMATGKVQLVHGMDPGALLLAVADQRVSVNMFRGKRARAGDDLFSSLVQNLVLRAGKHVLSNEEPITLPSLALGVGQSQGVVGRTF